jgi:hypothetical protein
MKVVEVAEDLVAMVVLLPLLEALEEAVVEVLVEMAEMLPFLLMIWVAVEAVAVELDLALL